MKTQNTGKLNFLLYFYQVLCCLVIVLKISLSSIGRIYLFASENRNLF